MRRREREYQGFVEEKNLILQMLNNEQCLLKNPNLLMNLEHRVANITKDLQNILQEIPPSDTENIRNSILEMKNIASNLKLVQNPLPDSNNPDQLENNTSYNSKEKYPPMEKKAKLFDLIDLESHSPHNEERNKHKTCFDLGGFSPVSVTEKCFVRIQRLREHKNISSFSGFVSTSSEENQPGKVPITKQM